MLIAPCRAGQRRAAATGTHGATGPIRHRDERLLHRRRTHLSIHGRTPVSAGAPRFPSLHLNVTHLFFRLPAAELILLVVHLSRWRARFSLSRHRSPPPPHHHIFRPLRVVNRAREITFHRRGNEGEPAVLRRCRESGPWMLKPSNESSANARRRPRGTSRFRERAHRISRHPSCYPHHLSRTSL